MICCYNPAYNREVVPWRVEGKVLWMGEESIWMETEEAAHRVANRHNFLLKEKERYLKSVEKDKEFETSGIPSLYDCISRQMKLLQRITDYCLELKSERIVKVNLVGYVKESKIDLATVIDYRNLRWLQEQGIVNEKDFWQNSLTLEENKEETKE